MMAYDRAFARRAYSRCEHTQETERYGLCPVLQPGESSNLYSHFSPRWENLGWINSMELRLIFDSRNSVFWVPIPIKLLKKLTERTQIHEPRSDCLLFCFVRRLWRKQLIILFSERDNSRGIISIRYRALATHQLGGQSQILKTKVEMERKTILEDSDRRGCRKSLLGVPLNSPHTSWVVVVMTVVVAAAVTFLQQNVL